MSKTILTIVILSCLPFYFYGENCCLKSEPLFSEEAHLIGFRIKPTEKLKASQCFDIIQEVFGLGEFITDVDGQVYGASNRGFFRKLFKKGLVFIEYRSGEISEECTIAFTRELNCQDYEIHNHQENLMGSPGETAEMYMVSVKGKNFPITNLNAISIIDKGNYKLYLTLDHKEIIPVLCR